MKNWLHHHPKRTVTFMLLFIVLLAFWQCLPEPLFKRPHSTILLTEEGQLLGARIADDGQWRFPASTSVADKFRQAIIHYEDKRFDSHPGVDPLALTRAIKMNFSAGHIVSGGSTLSMQVIRLAKNNPRRSYLEKLIEAIQALRLELRYSKDEILALYASHAPFGGNVVGLETAAWRYFGRSSKQLSWAESVTLAVLPNSPSLIHPGRNRLQLQQKRDQLLQKLTQQGLMSKTELKLALLEPLPEKPVPLPQLAPHLLDTLSKKAKGRRLITTLDIELQRKVTQTVQQHSRQLGLQGIYNAAAIVIDHHDFRLRAYVGNSARSGSAEHGYAIDIIRRPRSTGSLLKPFLFASMIQQSEILPKTLVADLPTQYGGYTPENYDHQYRGAVSAQLALARSLNVPAVRMLRRHGVQRFYDFLSNMGMSTLHRRAEDYGLTLILGGAEGNLWDLSNMYANLAHIARQQHNDSYARYQQTQVLSNELTASKHQIEINPATAWLTLNALLEVNRPGIDSYWKNFSSSKKLAWKTGTSYGLRDGWAIGNTGRYTIGVWVGNASGEGKPGLTGAATAAPILFDILNHLETSPWFSKPQHLMKQVNVCKDNGYLASDVCESELQWIPAESHFDQLTPHHRVVHLDSKQRWRVHSRCEEVASMQHKNWFVLPPGQAFYYRRHHINYHDLPPFRKDCQATQAQAGSAGPMELLYPTPGSRLYIPIDLAEKKSRAVFEAVHRQRDTTLFWHLDEQYLGQTTTFHKLEINVAAGKHRITVVDEQGNRLTRTFEVLQKSQDNGAS